MANDRIWVECDKCHERALLFKYYPRRQGYIWDAQATEDFLNRHLTICRGNPLTLDEGIGLSLKREADYVKGKHEYVMLGNDRGGYYIPREFAEYLLKNKLVPEDWQIQEDG